MKTKKKKDEEEQQSYSSLLSSSFRLFLDDSKEWELEREVWLLVREGKEFVSDWGVEAKSNYGESGGRRRQRHKFCLCLL